jgi:hypothetical protein
VNISFSWRFGLTIQDDGLAKTFDYGAEQPSQGCRNLYATAAAENSPTTTQPSTAGSKGAIKNRILHKQDLTLNIDRRWLLQFHRVSCTSSTSYCINRKSLNDGFFTSTPRSTFSFYFSVTDAYVDFYTLHQHLSHAFATFDPTLLCLPNPIPVHIHIHKQYARPPSPSFRFIDDKFRSSPLDR